MSFYFLSIWLCHQLAVLSPPIVFVTLFRLYALHCGQCIDYIIFPVSLDFLSKNVIYRKFSCLLCHSLFLYSLGIDIAVTLCITTVPGVLPLASKPSE